MQSDLRALGITDAEGVIPVRGKASKAAGPGLKPDVHAVYKSKRGACGCTNSRATGVDVVMPVVELAVSLKRKVRAPFIELFQEQAVRCKINSFNLGNSGK